MSFVFGGKLLGQDGPVVDTSSLEKLSKNEKLLLVELEMTRNNIAQELSVLKQCKGGDTSALDDAIVAYTEQKRAELYTTKNDPGKFYDRTRRKAGGKAMLSKTAALPSRPHDRSSGLAATGRTGKQPIKTALDTLPVFASMRPVKDSGDRNYGKSKTLPFRMPVFALPPISLSVQQNGTLRAVATPSKSDDKTNGSSRISKQDSSIWDEDTRAADPGGTDGRDGDCMTEDEEMAAMMFLMFSARSIDDVNMLLNIGLDPFAKRGSSRQNRPDLSSMSSFNAVAEQVKPSSIQKAASEFSMSGSRSKKGQVVGRSQTTSILPSKSKDLECRSESRDDIGSFGGTSMSMESGSFGGGHTMGSSTGGGFKLGGNNTKRKNKTGRKIALSPVTVDRMPSKNCGADELRNELLRSLTTMQRYTVLVKEDILSVNSVVDIRNPKAKAMMLAVAAERMRNILRVVISRELARGFQAWKLSVSQLRSVEKLKIFIRFRNVRNFANKLVWKCLKFIKRKFRHWRNIAHAEALRLKFEREKAAAVEIQRVFRGFWGRRKVTDMEDARKYADMYRATVKLQALFRCKGKRWKYLRYQRDKKNLSSTVIIQRVSRGFLGRKKFRRARLQANRDIAATMIQALVRGVAGRKKAKAKQHLRDCIRSAVIIQAQMRGFLARQMVDRILEEKLRDWGLRFIQRIFRGVLCRMNMHRKRKEIEDYRRHRMLMATLVQATYRGFRGRLLARAHIVQKRRKQTKLANAANKINMVIRAFNARAELKNRKKERLLKWVADASRWKETWSDDAQAWFYVDESTGDATWEPSELGYTRADGQLVLANGTTVDYYNVQNGGEIVDTDKVRLQNCIECAYRTAIRACNECGDVFCTKCYNETHAIGGRRTHTYTAVGPIDCSECEEVLAERWCVACDESYCDDCWRKVHNHGKRRAHPFSKVGPTGTIEPTMFTIDGEQVFEYSTVHAQHQHQLEQDSATMASAENSTVAWDASGYYNHDQGSTMTAEAGAESGYYDESGQWVYYDTTGQYDASQYDTSQYDATQYDGSQDYQYS